MEKKRQAGKAKKIKLNWNMKCILCIAVSLSGTVAFFILPYIRVLYYSMIDNQFRRNFVGLNNYIDTLRNEYFLLALKNSLSLIIICVPILVISALIISLVLSFSIGKLKALRMAFILPMLLPTASIVFIWKIIFHNTVTVLPIYILFIWKNIGICIILLTSALTSIKKEVFEAARLDGTKNYQLYLHIVIPMISPAIFFTTLLSIVYSFRIFKESYLYYGENYPPNHSYTLQYYMNNNFLKLDYQALSTSAVLTSILILLIVMGGLAIQRRYDN
jgi:multiple sugar transport system permease protein